jgi:hypothetical protein
VWKKGSAQPTVGKVWWEEIYPDVSRAPLVRRMPRLMLGKCAKAQAIRAAYPKKTGGLLIPEESQGREFTDITAGGRVVTIEPAVNPHEQKYLEREKEQLEKLTPAQREIVKERMAKASPKEGSAKEAGAATAEPSQGAAAPAEKPVLTYVWFNESESARLDAPTFPLMADFKAILVKLVRQGKVAPNGEELEALKFECEKRGIELRRRRE